MKNLSTIGSQIDSKILKQGDKRPRNVRARRLRRGASTLDFGLWFLLAIVVISALFVLFDNTRNSMRATTLKSQLVRAQAIVEDAYSYSGVFPASSLLVALSGKGFSGKELTRVSAGSYTFTSPFDTAITITGDGARDFTIAIAGLPQTGCEAALRAFQDSGAGLDSGSVGATALTIPLTEAAILTACDNTTNDVSLTF
jgi:hypothetical protein